MLAFLYLILLAIVDRLVPRLAKEMLNQTFVSDVPGFWHVSIRITARPARDRPEVDPDLDDLVDDLSDTALEESEISRTGTPSSPPPSSPFPTPHTQFSLAGSYPGAPPGAAAWRYCVTAPGRSCPHVSACMEFVEQGREGTGRTIRWKGKCSQCGSWREGANKRQIHAGLVSLSSSQ